MKIAMIGQKGMPASWGGVEQHVDNLTRRLATLGHTITVYSRRHYAEQKVVDAFNRKHKKDGIRVVSVPTVASKHIDTILHTFLATVHAMMLNVDVYHYHSVGPSLLSWLPRVFRPHARVVTTFHCVDRFHQKWGFVARWMLRMGEWTAVKFSHQTITVSKELQRYAKAEYLVDTVYIPNGVAEVRRRRPSLIRSTYGLKGNDYILIVTRLVPHKGVHYLIDAFKKIATDKKLVIVGGSTHTDAYQAKLEKMAATDDRIIMTGFQSGQMLEELFSNCYAYVQPSESEGLSVAVLEAAAYGRAVLTSDIPANAEIVEGKGFLFENTNVEHLRKMLKQMIAQPTAMKQSGAALRRHIRREYNWDHIAYAVSQLYAELHETAFATNHKFIKERA